MAGYITSFENSEYEIEVSENRGSFDLEINRLEDENKSIITLSRSDMLYLIKSIAEESTELAKEMIVEIVETI